MMIKSSNLSATQKTFQKWLLLTKKVEYYLDLSRHYTDLILK